MVPRRVIQIGSPLERRQRRNLCGSHRVDHLHQSLFVVEIAGRDAVHATAACITRRNVPLFRHHRCPQLRGRRRCDCGSGQYHHTHYSDNESNSSAHGYLHTATLKGVGRCGAQELLSHIRAITFTLDTRDCNRKQAARKQWLTKVLFLLQFRSLGPIV